VPGATCRRSRVTRRIGIVAVLALAACGGRSLLDPQDTERVVYVDASSPAQPADNDVYESSVPDGPFDSPAEASPTTDAGLDAPLEAYVDAGSGICPDPPLLTGNGAPLAPSWIEQLALGVEHTCLLIDGQVWCWGKNKAGELGDGTQVSRARPTRVLGIDNAVAIASGPAFDIGCTAARGSHTCALLNDATVKCWGANVSGDSAWQVQSFQPITINGLTGVYKLAVAGYSNCAMLLDGGTACWGVQTQPFSGLDGGIQDIAAGDGVYGLNHFGKVFAWNAYTYQSITTVGSPVQVPQLDSVTRIAAGWGHQCALKSNGTVWCWGANVHGQLGNGTTTNSWTVPVQAVGITNAVAIGIGSRNSCAILSDNHVKCWGDNSHGQAGNGTVGTDQLTPLTVPGLDKVIEIRGGYHHLCARKWDMSVWCWGANEAGELGDGTATDRAAPVHVIP